MPLRLIKLSLLAFYHRILPVTSPYRYTLYLIAGVVGAFSIATGLVRDPPLQLIAGLLTVRQASIFQCRRVPEAFGLHFPDSGARSSCEVDPFILQASIGVFNLATDLVLLALPIRIVYQLQISKKKRCKYVMHICPVCFRSSHQRPSCLLSAMLTSAIVGPALVFLVGVVGTVATAVRIGAIVKIERQGIAMATLSRWALTMSDIVWLSFVEINLAIMCANFPALAGLWNVMRRRYRSWRALSHRSDGRQQSCDVERSTRRPGWSLTTSDIPQKKRAKARSVSQEQLDLELAASNLSESNPAPTMSISEDDDDDDDDDDDEDEDLAGRFGPRVTKPNA